MIKKIALRHADVIQQFLKFGIVGAFGFIVDYAFLHVGLDLLHLGHYGSAFFSFPFAVVFTWIGNRLFTFKESDRTSAHAQLMRFVVVCAIGLFINRGAYIALSQIPIVMVYPILGLLGGTAASMFFNFFFVRRIVFR